MSAVRKLTVSTCKVGWSCPHLAGRAYKHTVNLFAQSPAMSPSSATDSATQTPSSIDPPAAAMPDFKIIPATSSDVPTLAEIIRASYLEEAAFRFAFPGQPKPEDVRHMFQVRLEVRVVSGDALLFKAADDSGKTLGFICFSHENAPKPAGEQAPKSDMQEKALKMSTMSMNMKFVMAMGMVAKELAAHCEGVEHWCEYSGPSPGLCR
jgi:hypothetical protein